MSGIKQAASDPMLLLPTALGTDWGKSVCLNNLSATGQGKHSKKTLSFSELGGSNVQFQKNDVNIASCRGLGFVVWEFWESTYWMETFHLAFEILPYSESELGMAISCLSGNLIADAWRNVKSSLVKKRRRCEV